MSRRNFKKIYKRFDETTQNKRDINKKLKEDEKKSHNLLIENFKDISKLNFINNEIIISKNGTSKFFKDILLETNKIHIITGNNGQGKSTILSDIANSTMLGKFYDIEGRLKIASNNLDICRSFNNNLNNVFKRNDEESDDPFILALNPKYKSDLSNLNSNITLYTDFSISYFTETTENSFNDLLNNIQDNYNKSSNGERKIKGINNIFNYLNKYSKIKEDELDKGVDLVIIMDEPESGLSLEIQQELYSKIRRYLNKYIKNNKTTLTFIISSHSAIWKNEKNVKIHNINDFKINNEFIKREHKKVFI